MINPCTTLLPKFIVFRLEFFLFVDLRGKKIRLRVEGMKKKKKKSSENDQLTGHFPSFFFFLFFLISPEKTVKVVR